MITIHKYPIMKNRVKLPLKAKPISIKVQQGTPTLWALVDPDEDRFEWRRIEGLLTGLYYPLEPEDMEFIDTVLLEGGDFVLHFFEIRS